MFEYISNHQSTFWMLTGFILLAIEGLVMGLTTGVILFLGLGAVVTGFLMWLGILPTTWMVGIGAFTLLSAVITALLWKPMMKLQNNDSPEPDQSSDLIGHTFRLDGDINKMSPGKTRYSGIDWRVEVDETSPQDAIESGERVQVSGVSAGIFRVIKATPVQAQ